MDISELYMSRCLELAAHGRGQVAPNPMVGAVLVASRPYSTCQKETDSVIIGEGFHRCYGEAHAETNAIASVRDEALLRRATLYTNLEPCSHFGKTAPCAALIIDRKIPRVVVATLDPNPKVAGRGIQMLREAGVEVVMGVMEREATTFNRFFMTAHRRHRPYIILKWAQSEDGFIDCKRKDVSEKPVQLSSTVTQMMVHQLRAEVQAILVGTHTALMDNPSLTVRYWTGKSPVRVLIDRHLRVPAGYHLFDGQQPTLVFTKQHPTACTERERGDVKYIQMENSDSPLRELAAYLYKNDIHSLLVEGGARLHRSFFEENLWDELIVETSPVRLGEGIKSASLQAGNEAQLVDRQYIYTGLASDKKMTLMEHFVNRSI